jgi:hypothetical protein
MFTVPLLSLKRAQAFPAVVMLRLPPLLRYALSLEVGRKLPPQFEATAQSPDATDQRRDAAGAASDSVNMIARPAIARQQAQRNRDDRHRFMDLKVQHSFG